MARIAIAGGTGGVGRAFVEALANTKHEVWILTRTTKDTDSSMVNVRPITVDYSSVTSIKTLLEDHRIDTVISALNLIDDAASQSQLNLVTAADLSGCTKRFIPSEYGIVANAETIQIDPYGRYILAAANALQETQLQVIRISTGFFMDFWGMPATHTTMAPVNWVFDIPNGLAVIPGSGEDRFSMAHTKDLARFVVRLLDEEKWAREGAVVGQDVTLHAVLGWIEKATGRKFDVQYDSVEDLRKGKCKALGGGHRTAEMEAFHASFGRLVVEGHMYLPTGGAYRLNNVFPELRTMTVEEMIETSWGPE